MIVPNVGMAILAAISCLMPRDTYSPYLDLTIQKQGLLGVPAELKYHGGWKKWRFDIAGTYHVFESKDMAMRAVEWVSATRRSTDTSTTKKLNDELKVAGLKHIRQKNDAAEAVVRLRYKNLEHHHCCCCQTKTKAGQRKRSEDMAFF